MKQGNSRHAERAAHHQIERVPVARPDETVAAVLAQLPGQIFDCVDTVYIVDAQRRLEGLVPMQVLLAASSRQAMKDLMAAVPAHAQPDQDQEKVAMLALRHNLTAVAVTDAQNRLLGVVPASALLEVLWREHTEDVHRLAGIIKEGKKARIAIEAWPWWRVHHRLPWLIVGLVGSVLATFVMTRFETLLQTRIAVAFFIPGIVYLADAVGTQTEAIMVRYLTIGHAPLWRLLRGELLTGLLIGVLLGIFVMPATWLAFGDARLALAVTAAVVVAGTCAAAVGLIFPWILSRQGMDPAFGSGPVATIIQDVLSLMIYFAMVLALLG